MEISDIRKRVRDRIERARRGASARRARLDEAAREYEAFLDAVAVPIVRQLANVLRAEGYLFTVMTPAGSVRLTSDKSGEDYLELALDTTGEPQVVGRTSRGRGRRVIATERPVRPDTPVRDLTEEDVLAFLLEELEPFVER